MHCIQVNVQYKQQVHINEPFNFDAIFYRIQILLHKSEPNRNRENQNGN